LIGQFLSKSIKVFRKIGWVSIPSKSIKVHWQSFWCRFTRSKNFVKENLNQVFDGKFWSCEQALTKWECLKKKKKFCIVILCLQNNLLLHEFVWHCKKYIYE
jgi:hypothetical protein